MTDSTLTREALQELIKHADLGWADYSKTRYNDETDPDCKRILWTPAN